VGKINLRFLVSLCVMLFLGSPFRSYSQEMSGISHSNFSGNMGMDFNPSLFVGSPYLYEWNFLSGDIFIDNNYLYRKRLSDRFDDVDNTDGSNDSQIGNYSDAATMDAYSSIRLRGPSYIRNSEKFSWGIHTAIRSATSVTNAPTHLVKFIKEGYDYSPQHDIQYDSDPFRAASMIWGELGGTYGKKIYEVREKKYLAAAATLKIIGGFDAAFIDFDQLNYVVTSPDSFDLDVISTTGSYGHSFTDDENTLKKPFKLRGYGVGLDLGLTYYHKRKHGSGDCNKSAEILKKYAFRAGLSILDVGAVRFGKQAETYAFSSDDFIWPQIDDAVINSVQQFDTTVSQYAFASPIESQDDDRLTIWLPSAIAFDFDYCIVPKFYANAAVVAAIPLASTAIVRSSMMSITPRYETRKFEASMPFVLHEFKTPHLGLALRYKWFVIGSDRIGAFTGIWNNTGYDLFFGFKLNVCEKGGKRSPSCPAYSRL
jgi:hypothetical protein